MRLPYVPNSMVMDHSGTNLYFGSPRELMVYTTATNTLTKQDTNVPGVVLAVSPNNSQVLINDQVRQVFYLYNAAAAAFYHLWRHGSGRGLDARLARRSTSPTTRS